MYVIFEIVMISVVNSAKPQTNILMYDIIVMISGGARNFVEIWTKF